MRAFIIGNGPSLNDTPLELLEGEVSWGVNQVHLIYPHTTWRPTHITFADRSAGGSDFFPKTQEAFLASPQAKRFLRDDALWWMKEMEGRWVDDEFVPYDNITLFSACTHHYILDHDGQLRPDKVPVKWHPPQICKFGGAVPITIQLAIREGADEIFLLGCDLDYRAGTRNHFGTQYAVDRPITEEVARLRNIGGRMGHKFSKANSPVPIYNATLGGSLEVYERVEFRSLF